MQPGLGNVGRNTILTAGPRDWSLTVQGMFKMPLGRVEQQALRLGFFKAFNHPNLGINNVGNTQATTSRTPDFANVGITRFGGRQIRLWVKDSF